MTPYYADDSVTLYHGDCRDVISSLPSNSLDACVTDPPYELGFMGRKWDASGIAYDKYLWAEVWRVLKPGGHLLAFGGTRTWHRLAVAIEDAGFEVRDSIAWQHSTSVFCRCSAVPYIHDPDDVRGVREAVYDASGMGEAGQESDVLASVQRKGAGARVGGARAQGPSGLDGRESSVGEGKDDGRSEPGMEGRRDVLAQGGELPGDQVRQGAGVGAADGAQGRLHHGASPIDGDDLRSPADALGSREPHQPQPAGQQTGESGAVPEQRGAQAWRGWPICYGCGKPLEPPFHPGPLAWQYGSGFPKSLDVSKAIDKAAGAEREVVGVQQGAMAGWSMDGTTKFVDRDITAPATDLARKWQGWGTALKPAFEPVVVARKPLVGTVAANVLQHGTGALNIDGCRIAADDGRPLILSKSEASTGILGDGLNGSSNGGTTTQGRWPANVILDESQAAELDRQSGTLTSGKMMRTHTTAGTSGRPTAYGADAAGGFTTMETYGDTGGASRFFYTAKADASERPRANGIAHPTVKPLSLMRHLVRLVTPPGGTVLEPFAGSGTTLEACIIEGFRCIAAEMTDDYLPLIMQRLSKPIEVTLL